MELSELQRSSWITSDEHGFHQAQLDLPPQSLATYLKLFLTIGELCEAGEELRAGRMTDEIYYTHTVVEGESERKVTNDKPWMLIAPRRNFDLPGKPIVHHHTWHDAPVSTGISGAEHRARCIMGKPEGFPIELADALIRLCDLAEDVGVDLTEATALKAAYNRTREHLHGKTA